MIRVKGPRSQLQTHILDIGLGDDIEPKMVELIHQKLSNKCFKTWVEPVFHPLSENNNEKKRGGRESDQLNHYRSIGGAHSVIPAGCCFTLSELGHDNALQKPHTRHRWVSATFCCVQTFCFELSYHQCAVFTSWTNQRLFWLIVWARFLFWVYNSPFSHNLLRLGSV